MPRTQFARSLFARTLSARTLAAIAAGTLAAAGSAQATPHVVESPLINASGHDLVATGLPARTHRLVMATVPKQHERSFAQFVARHGRWQGMWDTASGAPHRLWGQGIAAPGAMVSADAALAAAKAVLAEQLALFAPGATVDDFELITNQVHGSVHGLPMRTVAFAQRHQGRPILGASVGFLFKQDRIIVINSSAIDARAVVVPGAPVAPGSASVKARAWIEGAIGRPTKVAAIDPAVRILPLFGADGVVASRPVVSLDVHTSDAAAAGRWRVFVDAIDGTLVARESLLRYATGAVRYRVAERHPGRPRIDAPVPFTNFRVGTTTTPSNAAGQITWAGEASAQVTTALAGEYVRINNAAGAVASATLTVAPGGTAVWDRSTVAADDAQLTTYVAALKVKDYVRTNIDPNHPYLDQQLSATVNENDTCNAFSTGDDIHFFRASTQCENTGRLADVVYHEFGHSLHANSIIPGAGAFDRALSEGVSDYLAATITADPGMGRGFFFNDNALRHLDPTRDRRWPQDTTGEPHNDGEIIGGTLWDLRKAMIAEFGAGPGVAKADAIFYAVISRASDLPSTFVEALAEDDDDGNLDNGTPNLCLIRQAFGAHGLAIGAGQASGADAPTVSRSEDGGLQISVAVGGEFAGCPAPEVDAATVTWRVASNPNPQLVTMTRTGDAMVATIPAQPDGTIVEWSLELNLEGNLNRYPFNPADPFYQVYVGAVEPIYCTDFETDPGWSHAASGGGRDTWELATPTGAGGDPRVAASGTKVFGTALTDGVGQYEAGSTVRARTPVIDTTGFATVRLQYKRWLNVEDGFFDQASIFADGDEVWSNLNSNNGDESNTHHRDREWRFHDVDLSLAAADGSVQLEFALTSDQGLQFGGWTLDDVCIVGLRSAPGACGNGAMDGAEQCDDGNTASGDGCSATCAIEEDTGDDSGGCCSTGSGPGGSLVAVGLGAAVALVTRRRRRR